MSVPPGPSAGRVDTIGLPELGKRDSTGRGVSSCAAASTYATRASRLSSAATPSSSRARLCVCSSHNDAAKRFWDVPIFLLVTSASLASTRFDCRCCKSGATTICPTSKASSSITEPSVRARTAASHKEGPIAAARSWAKNDLQPLVMASGTGSLHRTRGGYTSPTPSTLYWCWCRN